MITLQNTLPHKAGTSINVKGTRYSIDKDGYVTVDPEHAKILLQNSAYREPPKKQAAKAPKRAPVEAPAAPEPPSTPQEENLPDDDSGDGIEGEYSGLGYAELLALCKEKGINLPPGPGRVKRTVLLKFLRGDA